MTRWLVLLVMFAIAVLCAERADLASASSSPGLPPAMLEVYWTLVTQQLAGQPAEPVSGAGLTFTFTADGRVHGSGGCNGFAGGYSGDASGALSITALAATAKFCAAPGVMDREQRYLSALLQVRGYALDGTSRLRLRFAESDRLLVYERAVAATPAPGGSTSATNVKGTATYRERIALAPNAVVQVQLVDVSLADAPATVLGEQTITADGRQPPYAFAISYDPAAIQQNHTYAVQARITTNGALLFITTQRYAVLTRGAPSRVDLVLQFVGGAPPTQTPPTGARGAVTPPTQTPPTNAGGATPPRALPAVGGGGAQTVGVPAMLLAAILLLGLLWPRRSPGQ